MVKQQGAMLAKGRLLGVQFDALFTDGLYLQLGRHAVELAMTLKAAFREKGYPLYLDSPTNQQFVMLTDEQLERLEQARWPSASGNGARTGAPPCASSPAGPPAPKRTWTR